MTMSQMQLIFTLVLLFLFVIRVDEARVDNWNDRYRNIRTRLNITQPYVNTRPIIGILSQELNAQIYRLCTLATYRSYIAASYVKFIEAAGARVVPIRIGMPDYYYEEIVNSVNGIFFPGDGTFDISDGYGSAAKRLYHLAIMFNLPLWGTGKGFEALIHFAVGKDITRKCNVNEMSLRLKFEMDFAKSRIFKTAPFDVISILKNEPITANTHAYCVTSANATKYKMDKDWLILSTTRHTNYTFVSSVESRKHRIWAIRFHPEKNSFEWNKDFIVHSPESIKVAQYFANFFINEARKNNNSFPYKQKETDHLIYNYIPMYTAKHGCPFEQCYLF